jgi:hypothetical protein
MDTNSFDAYCKAQQRRITRRINGRMGRMRDMLEKDTDVVVDVRGSAGGAHATGRRKPPMDAQGPQAKPLVGAKRRPREAVWGDFHKRQQAKKAGVGV